MMYMAYPLKVDKLLLNEYQIIDGIVKGETTDEALERYSNFIPRFVNRLHRYFTQHGHTEDEMIELIVNVLDQYEETTDEALERYSNFIPRFVNRLHRYFTQHGHTEDEMIELIVNVLDQYELVYSVNVVKDTLDKMKDFDFKPLRRHEEVVKYYKGEIDLICQIDNYAVRQLAFALLTVSKFKPLRRHEEVVKYYKGEIDLICQIDNYAVRQLAFALLTVSKLRMIRFADPTIMAVQVVDVSRLVKGGKVKDEIYFMLHELVKREMVTVPLLDDKITINFTQHEGEVVYELGNTEIFKLLPTFNKLCGEYVEPSSRKVLEISLVEDYHAIHPSIAQATKSHNERGGKVDKSAITKCIGKKRASADNCLWIELEGEITEDYISKLVKFGREVYRKQFTKVNKKKGEWIITQDFIGAVIKETGEVLIQV